jgi:SAM-dependent methyltransferase
MSEADRVRWDERYATGDYLPRTEPSPFLESALRVVPPGRALVLACGTGRNALHLSEAKFDVEAIDISSVAIDQARTETARRGLRVQWRVADLDEVELDAGAYDLITLIRYFSRDAVPQILKALAPDGWLLVEQHMRTRLDVIGPGTDFRLATGELLDAFSELRIVTYSEVLQPSDVPGKTAALTRLLACKGDPGW